MIRSAKLHESRNVVRFVLIAVSGLWLTGCSSDATRFTEAMNQPFNNPFGATPAPTSGAAPTPSVSSQPLAANSTYQAPAHPSPVASTRLAEPAPIHTGSIRAPSGTAVSGGPGGWSPVGGSPVMVIQGDTADSLARRYGVPPQALLSANGLSSASQVHPGMHVVIPVYNAHAVSSRDPAPIPTASEPTHRKVATADTSNDEPAKGKTRAKGRDKAVADDRETDTKSSKSKSKVKMAANDEDTKVKGKRHSNDDADATPVKGKKAKHEDKTADSAPAKGKEDVKSADLKSKGKDKSDVKTAELKSKDTKTADAKADKKADKQTAKADKAAPAETTKVPGGKADVKTAQIDNTPTARTGPAASTEPVKTATEADSNGANPEFRWPARGRVIQGFKTGGNDGINIAVPEGTSVRAAESGVVAYAGSELKGYGNLILIRHPNGFVTAYANNGEIGVKRGEQVKRGQVIAKSGESGNVSTPQLHFELRDKAGQPVDPTSYLAGI